MWAIEAFTLVINFARIFKQRGMFEGAHKFNSDVSKWDVARSNTIGSVLRAKLPF